MCRFVEVCQSFTEMSLGRAVTLIPHRLGCARLADWDRFFDASSILKEGRHYELLARGVRWQATDAREPLAVR